MSVEHYKRKIAEQKKTGIITVRCECTRPAEDYKMGGTPCAECIRIDTIRIREYNKAEDTRRKREAEETE